MITRIDILRVIAKHYDAEYLLKDHNCQYLGREFTNHYYYVCSNCSLNIMIAYYSNEEMRDILPKGYATLLIRENSSATWWAADEQPMFDEIAKIKCFDRIMINSCS